MGEKWKLLMPLFLCNPQSSFYSNLIQLSGQQEAEGRQAHQHCWAAPFPTHPQPWRVPQTPTPMEQHLAFPVIYAKRFVHFDLHQPLQTRSPGCIFCPLPLTCWQRCLDLQPGGGFVSIQSPVAAATSAGRIPALSVLSPNCINSVSKGAYAEISCSQPGLSAPSLCVVKTGGEIC